MSSLFLRIYLSTLAFLVIAFFTISFFANNFYPINSLISNSNIIPQEVNHYLKDKPQEDWQDAIRVFNTFADGAEVSLISKDELTQSETERLNASQKGVIKGDNRIGNISMISTLPDGESFLRIKESDLQEDMSFYDWLDIFLPLLLIFSTLAFGLFLIIRKLTQPIQHLNEVAQQLGQGNLKVRAKSGLPTPLNRLADGFNSMAEQLNETMQEQHILIGAIPHELRTPLGRIRFALDMTRNDTTVSALRGNIENIDGYVDEMQETVDEILELNRLQNQQQVDFSKFDIYPLIDSLLERSQKESPKLVFTIDGDKSLSVSGNAPLIKRAVSNILNNAQRYAKTTINIQLAQNNKETIIIIEDDGDGIANDKWLDIFSPFSTLDDSRGRNNSGIGLGLAIVKLIMKKHAGDVVATRSDLGGARFQLHWRK